MSSIDTKYGRLSGPMEMEGEPTLWHLWYRELTDEPTEDIQARIEANICAEGLPEAVRKTSYVIPNHQHKGIHIAMYLAADTEEEAMAVADAIAARLSA